MPKYWTAVIAVGLIVLAACGSATQTATDAPVVSGVAEAEPAGVDPTTTTATPTTATPTTEPTTSTTAPYLINLLDGGNGGAETSQQATETNQLPVRTFERFELAPETSVGIVQWRGIYSFCQDRDGVPDPHATAFVIEIYGDDDGEPDTAAGPVYATTIDVADSGQTFDSTRDQPCRDRPESTWAFYDYEASLDTPFVSAAGQWYWLMIQAVTPGFSTFWGWQSSSDGPASLQEFDGELKPVSTGARAYALLPPD